MKISPKYRIGAGVTACVLGVVLLPLQCRAQDNGQAARETEERKMKVYHSPLAGRWYAGDRETLAADIASYVDAVNSETLDNVHALVLPHAGYRYSGSVAAFGTKQVTGKQYSRVIVLGPSHRVSMPNVVSFPDATHYATPLGTVTLDVDFIAALGKSTYFRNVPQAHDGEHSVQIEVPVLQQALGEFKLVPLVVGQLGIHAARQIGAHLRRLIDRDTLVVASSDFTHYGTSFRYVPFRDDREENLRKLDMSVFEQIERLDLAKYFEVLENTGATVCGRCPIGVLMAMQVPGTKVHLLKYDTSGRMTKDFDSSVSYLAIAFTGGWQLDRELESDSDETPRLGEEDRNALLGLARKTIDYYLIHKKKPTAADVGVEITPGMRQIMGAFVTLHKEGRLRGCIGEIVPRRPLFEAVLDQAVNSACFDHRFHPVTAGEVAQLHVEISALLPPRPVASYEDIVIGKHGIVLQKHGRRSVYLPHVATEQGWDLPQTLSHLSRKAGLSAEAWREGATFQVFEAIVFGEER